MSAGTIVAIIVVVIIVAAVIAAVSLAARRRRLQQRFGPEYDRVVEDSSSRLRAESELAGREKRVRELDIRPLDPAARASYLDQWTAIQQQFVDAPADAVTAAQSLITTVMTDRGYPAEDAGQILADLSVEHATTLGHFRTAQDISTRVADGDASTEDMRQAMIHYRILFQDLLGDPATADPAIVDPATGESAEHEPAEHEPTEPVAVVPDMTDPAAVGPRDQDVTDSGVDDTGVFEPVPDDRSLDESGLDESGLDESGLDERGLDERGLDDQDLDDQALDEPQPAAASRLPWRR
jgi:hypothetical protein